MLVLVSLSVCGCFVQVDLFFFREAEDTKDQEEEEIAAVTDFGNIEYGGGAMAALGSDQWAALPDHWGATPEVAAAPAVAPVAGADWTAAAAPGKSLFLLLCCALCWRLV